MGCVDEHCGCDFRKKTSLNLYSKGYKNWADFGEPVGAGVGTSCVYFNTHPIWSDISTGSLFSLSVWNWCNTLWSNNSNEVEGSKLTRCLLQHLVIINSFTIAIAMLLIIMNLT